jgi:hypothetical protein
MQTARQGTLTHARNDTGFRTVASTPKERKLSFSGTEDSGFFSPKNGGGLSAITFK